ncbi:GNAT family N-acetyltransferase [Streptomyces sp. NPDC088748]|uniref:GNAT family N-acetyltransferase n=1 Tax=Streptomyces sp. NPDC088748 TaxID=3365887 RepID=UPI00382D91B6
MDYIVITDPTDTARALDDIAPRLRSRVRGTPYLEGPRDLALFLETYQHEHKVPGFRRVLARTADRVLAGFAYGLPLSSGTSWWDGFLDATPAAAFTREDGRRTFVVKELAVLSDRRGHGVGRELHQHLIHGITADRATLTVRPEARAAAWYERLGYALVGHTQPWESAPIYRTLHKPLRP